MVIIIFLRRKKETGWLDLKNVEQSEKCVTYYYYIG